MAWTIHWTLHYHATVVRYLVSLRQSGSALRIALRSLETKPFPDVGLTLLQPNIYLWEVEAHRVTYEVMEDQRTISVSSVQPQAKD